MDLLSTCILKEKEKKLSENQILLKNIEVLKSDGMHCSAHGNK